MISGLSVCDGEVWADEVEFDAEEIIYDLADIITVMFNTFIDEGKNTRHFSDGMNCRHI